MIREIGYFLSGVLFGIIMTGNIFYGWRENIVLLGIGLFLVSDTFLSLNKKFEEKKIKEKKEIIQNWNK